MCRKNDIKQLLLLLLHMNIIIIIVVLVVIFLLSDTKNVYRIKKILGFNTNEIQDYLNNLKANIDFKVSENNNKIIVSEFLNNDILLFINNIINDKNKFIFKKLKLLNKPYRFIQNTSLYNGIYIDKFIVETEIYNTCDNKIENKILHFKLFILNKTEFNNKRIYILDINILDNYTEEENETIKENSDSLIPNDIEFSIDNV